nr:unnamed protein product [Callosobruchus analis]
MSRVVDLDEPTVGVDPILRANIWNYMVHEVKEQKTSIIITTHYIEEAKQAHTIGLMRDGKLLAEDSPSQLLSTYGCANLEDVFLKLARQQKESKQDELKTVPPTGKEAKRAAKEKEGLQITEEQKRGCCQNFYYDLKHFSSCARLRALLFRNLLRVVRNLLVLLLVFALPVVQVVLFCLCIGHEPRDLTVAIANDEVDYDSRRRIDCPHNLDCSVSIKNNTPHINEAENLSCRYIEYLKIDTLDLEYYPDMDSCRKSVEDGEAWACLHFKKDFTKAVASRMKKAWGKKNVSEVMEEAVSGDIELDDIDIDVWIDQSGKQWYLKKEANTRHLLTLQGMINN